MIGYDGYLQITTSFPTIAIPDAGFLFLTTSSNMKDKTPHAATLRDMCFIVTAILYVGGFLSEHRNLLRRPQRQKIQQVKMKELKIDNNGKP